MNGPAAYWPLSSGSTSAPSASPPGIGRRGSRTPSPPPPSSPPRRPRRRPRPNARSNRRRRRSAGSESSGTSSSATPLTLSPPKPRFCATATARCRNDDSARAMLVWESEQDRRAIRSRVPRAPPLCRIMPMSVASPASAFASTCRRRRRGVLPASQPVSPAETSHYGMPKSRWTSCCAGGSFDVCLVRAQHRLGHRVAALG